jgi:tetratricopeptide (TPR) repeat protein
LLGCATPYWEFILSLGVLGFVGLWASHVVLTRRFTYRSDAISVCLLGLVLLTAVQLVPLPVELVRVISPTTAEWHTTLLPRTAEVLPNESEEAVPQPPRWVRLSLAPSRTEDVLLELLMVFVVYTGVRNFVASDPAFLRLAWVGFATGLLLALLGLSQFLAGKWLHLYPPPEQGGPGFGPFLNKNHFAFQVALFAGLSIGLYLRAARRDGPASPAAVGIVPGLGLMIAAIGFSQSRGGLVAAGAATLLTLAIGWWARRGRERSNLTGTGLILVAGAGLVALGMLVAYGGKAVSDRISTIWGGAIDERAEGWREVRPLIEMFPLFGVGGGGLARAERVVRTQPDSRIEFNTLDNEYLEAAVEGGLLRLGLTVALALAAVGTAAVGYRRRRNDSIGCLLLGCVFGLGAVALHSAGDYGLHTPSVALTAAVVAGHVSAARPRSRRADTTPNGGSSQPLTLTGGAAILAAGGLVLTMLTVVGGEWRQVRVTRLLTAAAALRTRGEEYLDVAISYQQAAVAIRPTEPAAWYDLMASHLAAANFRWQAAVTALAGGGAIVKLLDPTAATDPNGHMTAALQAARQARNRQPLYAEPHLVLGSYTDRFHRSEPWSVHLDRAKRVGSSESQVWLIRGQVAASQGDWATAMSDWREALLRSPQRLPSIVQFVNGRLTPEQFRTHVLPDDPVLWYAATPLLFPNSADPARRAWIQAAINRWSGGPEPDTVASYIAWGTALEELKDPAVALRVWQAAVTRFPDQLAPRDRLAARLEAEEEYEAAIPLLEWLIAREPSNSHYTERLAAARHALKLKADIDRP